MNNVVAVVYAACVACVIPAYALWTEHNTFVIAAGAEDDCPYYYGAYALDDVVGVEIDGHHAVECRYRSDTFPF